jgi:hypothetical protein
MRGLRAKMQTLPVRVPYMPPHESTTRYSTRYSTGTVQVPYQVLVLYSCTTVAIIVETVLIDQTTYSKQKWENDNMGVLEEVRLLQLKRQTKVLVYFWVGFQNHLES